MLPYLRQRPQSTKLWLSIYKPPTMLACQVNDASITVGEETITYDNVTSGSYAGVRAGMTMYVGSVLGGKDLGRIRVKSADATTITIAENSEINWQDDLYLTVVDFWEVWPVFPFYIQLGDTVTFYKDKDVAYTDQNSNVGMGSLVCMGTHYAGFVGDQVYYTATGTLSVSGQDPLSYLWFIGGSSSTGSNLHTPGYVTYNTPGHFTTVLVVETASGEQDVSYRHVSIYNRPEDGTSNPILRWELEELKGSRDEGGYTAKIKVWEDVSDIVDGALIVLFADDIYGTDVLSIGGNAENRSKIFFAGYILNGSIEYNYQDSSVSFEVGSSTQIMKQQSGLSISIDSVASPTTWYELEDLNVLKAIYHYYRWHTTLLNTTDLRYIGTNYPFQYFDTESASLYDAMSSFLQQSLLGYLICDRQNNLYAEVGAETYDDLTLIPYDIDILRQDWINEPEITIQSNKQIAYLELSGVAWSGVSTGTWTEYIAAAPGSSLSYYGDIDSQTGLILVDQNTLNILVGNVFAYKNALYPDITMDIAGNYRNFEIVPLKRELLTIFPEDTHKGIQFTQKPFHITEIDWSYDPQVQSLYPVITLYELAQGYPGVTIERPQTPIVNYPELPPIDAPPFPIIPLPTPNPIPPPIVPSPPPVDDPTCITDDNAPANGPYNLWQSGVLQSNIPTQLEAIGVFRCVIRKSTAVNKSGVIVDGYWQKSDDGGITWQDWLDNNYWGVSEGPNAFGIQATPASDPWPQARMSRTFYWDSLAAPLDIGATTVWIDYLGGATSFISTGTGNTYWLYGPFDIVQIDAGASVQYHTGTATIPPLASPPTGTVGDWFTWMINSPQGKNFAPRGSSPLVWGTASPVSVIAGQWNYNNGTPFAGDNIDYIMQGLLGTGSSKKNTISSYAAWDGTYQFNGNFVGEIFPPAPFNYGGGLMYMVINGGGPTVYRITIYNMYIFNICYLPDEFGGYP